MACRPNLLGTGLGGIEMDWDFIFTMLIGLPVSIITSILWWKLVDVFEKGMAKANKKVNRKY